MIAGGKGGWGNLVVTSRNLAYKLNAYIPANDIANRDWLKMMITNFPLALKEHLRGGVKFGELRFPNEKIEERLRSSSNVCGALVNLIYERLNVLIKSGTFSGEQLITLDKELSVFSEVLGSCERIRNTPIPYSYSMYLKKFIFTFLITLPFAFVTEFEYFTIPIVMFLFFILVSIELIAEEIEDPFGTDENDLPTNELTFKIMKEVTKAMESSDEILPKKIGEFQ